jgi:hypothetical protein
MIYLVKSENRQGTYYKVGYTSNLVNRLIPYFTHNPSVELLETIKTYRKTNRELEVAIHSEIIEMGYTFKVAKNGSETEWFFVPMDKEKEFQLKGLAQFMACKNRVINRVEA